MTKLVNSDIIYNGQVDLRFEEINALPPNKNYWQHFDIIKEKFVNDAFFCKKGELDTMGEVRNTGFRFKATSYQMFIKNLECI